jgi:hypothetical protein
MVTLLLYHSPIFSLIVMRLGAEDWELGQSVSLLAASCWQGALYGAGSSDSCGVLVGPPQQSSGRFWRGWCPWKYNWLNFWLARADVRSKRNLCTVFMTQGRKLKNGRARNIGIRTGIGQENHCEMFPRGFQEPSNSLLHFSNCYLRGAATGGYCWAWQQQVSWEWPDEGCSIKVPMERVKDPLREQDPLV